MASGGSQQEYSFRSYIAPRLKFASRPRINGYPSNTMRAVAAPPRGFRRTGPTPIIHADPAVILAMLE
jgi:hypothetical protein